MRKTYLRSLKAAESLKGVSAFVRLCLCLGLQILSLLLPAELSASSGTLARDSWRNLLFFSQRWLRHDTSLVDSPEFFLAADGAYESDHELKAFIAAIQKDDPKLPEKDRIACRFPARTLWLKRFRPDLRFPAVPCPQYEDWLALSQPKAVSLIFSSYYINNPSSMMGHTFLRLRRGRDTAAPLLDKAVNFAAEPTNNFPVLYSVMGLTGSFPGKFSLMPYYSKVQEYANAESRDLWEYDLDFSEEETLAMMASLWEQAPLHIDYYFFDENCSAILLFLLQTARPGLAITDKLGSFVHPSDTVRLLMEEPGLVHKIVYRPSTRSRYLAQFQVLSQEEKALVRGMVERRNLGGTDYEALAEDRKAATLDATLAYIEFDDGLYGSKKPVKNAALYEQALDARSQIATAPMTEFPQPPDEAPQLGHRGRRLGFGVGTFEDAKEMLLEYRPGQHDLLSPSIGYPPELSIELGKTRAALKEGGKVTLRGLELFHILSFNPTRSGRLPWSWQMQFNYENTVHRRLNLLGSIGQAISGGSRDNYAFAFFDSGVKVEENHAWACPGATLGGRWAFTKRFVQFTQLSLGRCYSRETRPWLGVWKHGYRWSVDARWEMFLEGEKTSDSHEYAVGLYRYY